jgi:hypothetical protein
MVPHGAKAKRHRELESHRVAPRADTSIRLAWNGSASRNKKIRMMSCIIRSQSAGGVVGALDLFGPC